MNTSSAVRIVDSADVAADATIGDGSSIWHLAQVREGAVLGANCVIGRGAYIGTGVDAGRQLQGAELRARLRARDARRRRLHRAGASCSPTTPTRARSTPTASLKSAHDWEPVGVTIATGASIGARADVRRTGDDRRWATVAAGSVVIRTSPTSPSSPACPRAASAGSGARASASSETRRRLGLPATRTPATSKRDGTLHGVNDDE